MLKTDRIHKTVPVRVWVDIDQKIAAEVRFLNALPGVRTFSSCQGTIGEGGAAPYEPYIAAWWPKKYDAIIRKRYRITRPHHARTFAHLHPKPIKERS